MQPSEAYDIVQNPDDYTAAQVKQANKVLRAYSKITERDRTGGPDTMAGLGMEKPISKPKKPKKKMAKGGYAKCGASNPATQASTKMAYGGMVKKGKK